MKIYVSRHSSQKGVFASYTGMRCDLLVSVMRYYMKIIYEMVDYFMNHFFFFNKKALLATNSHVWRYQYISLSRAAGAYHKLSRITLPTNQCVYLWNNKKNRATFVTIVCRGEMIKNWLLQRSVVELSMIKMLFHNPISSRYHKKPAEKRKKESIIQ